LTLVMTDVFGAEGPPERFSSLLIRAAWAAAAADGSGLEDSCGMAQAFKFPTEAYDGSPRSPGLRSFAQAHRLVGSPLPAGPVQAGSASPNMGLPPARRKRAAARPMRPWRSRFPVRAILAKVNQSGLI